ncbi:efflux RND transporter periplasmic adaptor subunit [Celerinatantimonas sp. YJH-8]|uniref:efflux RND transporter periplasmic adaptor subunit n=1 Tax=Celerinatantimonas sp. YJH-8 TaxID=3228714 RepID=UPI0038C3E1A7
MRRFIIMGITLIIGILIGVSAYRGFTQNKQANNTERKPLYWVAPMNPSYHSDKPGKSPMGMDLVPVYADDNSPTTNDAGNVTISSSVENNLGIRLGKVTRQPWENTIATLGIFQIDPYQQVNVTPRVSGWIEKQFVQSVGDPITQGQPLYTLYSPDLVNAQRELLVALRRGDQSMIQASELRLQALQVPDATIRTLKKQRKVLRSITLYAPASGIMHQITAQDGDFVKPGKMLFSIADLSKLWLNAEVFAEDAAAVQLGAPVEITVSALPGRQWLGKVDYIYPEVDPSRRTIHVRVVIDNRDRALKPNMYAHVIIHDTHTAAVLQVPQEAVIRTGAENRVVMTDGKGHFKSVAVEIGRVNDHAIEILKGLQDGDQIVTSAQFLIDSESSIDSDLARMSPPSSAVAPQMDTMNGMDMPTDHSSHTAHPASRSNMDNMNQAAHAVEPAATHSSAPHQMIMSDEQPHPVHPMSSDLSSHSTATQQASETAHAMEHMQMNHGGQHD